MSYIRVSACATAAALSREVPQSLASVSATLARSARVSKVSDAARYHAVDQRKVTVAPSVVAAGAAMRSLTTHVESVKRDVHQIIKKTPIYADKLDLSCCALTELPKAIIKFKYLKEVDLRENDFNILTPAVMYLFVMNKSLEKIDLSDNPMWDDLLLPKYLVMKERNPKIQIIIDSSDGPVPFLK
jgi:hypothetical protein